MNEIVSMGKKCVGNDKSVRYSPQIMKLALSLWTRSKKSYKILFDSKLLVLPNPRTLHYIKRKNLATEKVVDNDIIIDAFDVGELDGRFGKIGLLVEYITKAKVFGSYKKKSS